MAPSNRALVQADDDGHAPNSKTGCFSRCFPCSPCGCLGPKSWNVVQDGVHLSLLVGFVSLFALAFAAIRSVVNWPLGTTATALLLWAGKSLLVAPISLYLFPYMSAMIGGYDLSMQKREKKVAQRREHLVGAYEGMLLNMDDMLQRASRSAAGLAESNFESKRRDFVRFLTKVEEKHGALVMTDLQAAGLLIEFKKFLEHWLAMFAECSANPAGQPLLVVSAVDLSGCRTVQAAARLVIDGLQRTQVRVIGDHADQDEQMIAGARQFADRMGLRHQRAPAEAGPTIEMSTSFVSCAPAAGEARDAEAGLAGTRPARGGAVPPQSTGAEDRGCGWVRAGPSMFGVRRPLGGGFPAKIGLGCVEVKMLSDDHAKLLLMSIALFAVYLLSIAAALHQIAYTPTPKGHENTRLTLLEVACREVWNSFPVLGVFQAVVVLLACFESIDAIQRLERQISKLESESQALERRQEAMHNFWENVQAVTDIWAYRTVPRLSLMKEVHSGLADVWNAAGLLHALQGANLCIKHLENNLPELSLWSSNGPVTKEQKMRFEAGLKKVCFHADNLPELLEGVDALRCSTSAMPRIAPGTSFTC